MSREIEITIGDTVAVARLLDKEAPKTCDAIWNILPFENEAHAAKIAGLELYFMATPQILIEEMENPMMVHETPPGTISYFPPRPYIQVFFGDLLPAWNVKVNAFARIMENFDAVKEAAGRAWEKPGDRIIVRKRS